MRTIRKIFLTSLLPLADFGVSSKLMPRTRHSQMMMQPLACGQWNGSLLDCSHSLKIEDLFRSSRTSNEDYSQLPPHAVQSATLPSEYLDDFLNILRHSTQSLLLISPSLYDRVWDMASLCSRALDGDLRTGNAVQNATLSSEYLDDFLNILRRSMQSLLVISPSLYDRIWDTVSRSRGAVDLPSGPRWAIAGGGTDLTGTWLPIVTSSFKEEVNSFLSGCGQPYLLRKVVVNALAFHREVIRQVDQGRILEITSANPIGTWKRTLLASGADDKNSKYEVVYDTIRAPGGGEVRTESWWENHGAIHKSWMNGSSKFDGGDFESSRYLAEDNLLVCELKFHPTPNAVRERGLAMSHLVWRFMRALD